MADELEEAAAKGRAERAAADAERARAQARSDEDERVEAERRYWASVSRWGIFRVSGMGFYYLFMLWLFVLGPLNIFIFLWLRPPEWIFHVLVPGRGRLYLPIPATLVAIAIWYVAGFMCRRAVARERAFLASLPFAVTGWEERLGVYPSKTGHDLAFIIGFVDATPGAELVRDVLSSDGGTCTPASPSRRWRSTCAEILSDHPSTRRRSTADGAGELQVKRGKTRFKRLFEIDVAIVRLARIRFRAGHCAMMLRIARS